jgi:hypothetical protein
VKPAIPLLIFASAGALPGCRSETPRPSAKVPVPVEAAAVVRKSTVIAFWLPVADTLRPKELRRAREQFRRSNQVVANYLQDTDITLIATVKDTVVIHLQGGATRLVMLSGLDFPYGYLFIEPGYAEEFHTGPTSEDDIENALDDYFGLEPPDSSPPHRIARAALIAQAASFTHGPRRRIP